MPALSYEHDSELVGVLERDAVLGPVGVRGRHRIEIEACHDRLHGCVVAEVENEERLGMRLGRPVAAARCQLEMRTGPRTSRKTPS